MKQLEKAKSAHAGNRSEFETKLSTLRKEQAETQRKINALIDSLADFSDSTAAVHLKKRIEELNGQDAALSSRIRELESLTDEGVLAGMEFDLMRQLLTVFHDNIDDMTVTQNVLPSARWCARWCGTARWLMWCSLVHRRMRSTGPPSR